MRFYLIIALVLFTATGLLAIDDVQLHLKVIAMEEAEPPLHYFGKILFTVKPEEETRFVGISFAHEEYKQIHPFQHNQMGVFFLLMDAPDLDFLDYRLVVDGIWQNDPMAEERIMGNNGIQLSRIHIPDNNRPTTPTPLIMDQGWVEFTLQDAPGGLVYLAGDFNQWDPYMIKMDEVEPGVYRSLLRLGKGTHYYGFFINGALTLDPENRDIRINPFGEEVSSLFIP